VRRLVALPEPHGSQAWAWLCSKGTTTEAAKGDIASSLSRAREALTSQIADSLVAKRGGVAGASAQDRGKARALVSKMWTFETWGGEDSDRPKDANGKPTDQGGSDVVRWWGAIPRPAEFDDTGAAEDHTGPGDPTKREHVLRAAEAYAIDLGKIHAALGASAGPDRAFGIVHTLQSRGHSTDIVRIKTWIKKIHFAFQNAADPKRRNPTVSTLDLQGVVADMVSSTLVKMISGAVMEKQVNALTQQAVAEAMRSLGGATQTRKSRWGAGAPAAATQPTTAPAHSALKKTVSFAGSPGAPAADQAGGAGGSTSDTATELAKRKLEEIQTRLKATKEPKPKPTKGKDANTMDVPWAPDRELAKLPEAIRCYEHHSTNKSCPWVAMVKSCKPSDAKKCKQCSKCSRCCVCNGPPPPIEADAVQAVLRTRMTAELMSTLTKAQTGG